jgi:hypothetical protein
MKAKSNMKNSDDRGKCKLDDAEFDELDAADGIKDAYMNPSSPSHPSLKTFVTIPKPRSQTPARPLLILAPLPLAKPKSITDKA